MAHVALYRKYRPKKLSEVVGQEHVTKSLANGLKGQTTHAYLFTGPHGVGKTSVARILAHEINDITYSETPHLDIIEIDAASNRRIDEVRELRDKINLAPAQAAFKVYIIDEVHMLTKEAFNALLKTLEEPPEHAIFILATTEAHKLPATIVSRTQRHQFKPLNSELLADYLKKIAAKEKISIKDEALMLVAEHADGSVRDGLSLLEQLSTTSNKIDLGSAEDILGLAPTQLIQQIIKAVEDSDIAGLADRLSSASKKGYQPSSLAYQLINYIGRQHTPDSLELTEKLLKVQGSSHPKILLETELFKASLSNLKETPMDQGEPAEPPEKANPPKTHVEQKVEPPEPKPPANDNSDLQALDPKTWKEILKKIKEVNNSLYAIVRMAEPSVNGLSLVLKFKFPFHQKRLSEEANKRTAEKIIREVTKKEYSLASEVSTELQATQPEVFVRNGASSSVENIIDVMGGGEVVDI